MTLRFLQKLVLFSTFLLLGVSRANASHIAAIDLYVDYIGNTDPCTGKPSLDYSVTLILYAACEPTSVNFDPTDGLLRWESANAAFFTSKNMTPVMADGVTPIPPGYTGDIVHQLCPAFEQQNSCNTPANFDKTPGYRRWIFKTTVILNSAQTDWKFWWSLGARNGKIKNIVTAPNGNSPQGDAYVEAGINNVAKADVSTPRFTTFPLPYICVNNKFKYLNGPVDGDVHRENNSLSTYSITPLQAANGPYFYRVGYSQANPIGSVSGFFVNSLTGVAEFTPPFSGPHVLAFRCDKTDKNTGALLAYTTRDVQVAILDCQQAPPVIDSLPQQLESATWKSYNDRDSAIYVCPGSSMTFNITAYNSNPSKVNNLYWETNIANLPGSTFTTSGEGTDTIRGTFSWTPGLSDVGDHDLTIIAKDSTCDSDLPIVLRSPAPFIIRVTKGIDAGPDLVTCQFNPKGHQVFVKGTEYKLRVEWSALDGSPAVGLDSPFSIRPTIYASGHNEYLVKTPDLTGQCKARDTLVLKPDMSNTIDVFPNNPIILCRPDYLQLDARFTGKQPLKNMVCGTDHTSDCVTPDSVTIFGSPSYEAFISFDTLGPAAAMIPNDVFTAKQQFLITKQELRKYGLEPSTIKSISFEVVNEQDPNADISNFSISLKCTNKKELNRNTGFEDGTTNVYTATSNTKFTKGWHKFTLDKPYNWDTTQNLIVQLCFGDDATLGTCNSIIRYVPTSYVSSLKLKSANPATTNVCGTIKSTLIDEGTTRPLFGITFCNAPVADMEYTWTPATFLSDSTILRPLAYVPKSIKYVLKTMGRNGCTLYDTADIYIPEHNYAVWPADTAICFNETAPMHTTGGGFTYKWYRLNDKGEYEILSNTKETTCWDCADPVLRPLKTTVYKIAVYDSVWCIDTLTAKVTVKPLPDIKILTRDTFVKYGQSLQLMASGARIYNWSPVGSLNNANTSFPIATPTEPTTYIAGGIGANGCRAFDTVKVDIDYRDNLFVPTGFSPNNDGKNDLFKVANLTFQKVIEFRVFNRWGQEVFMANDNRGWDGNWKGEPQDMDTYTYSIKIGFPDGYIESYRGNTTLIR
ncbi:gliding motility-associated C-terminal domain-containing protein [Polluticoccus soli]|uniref:gliding motility-associated C-terminal domain-containing protein n=1 Tax=Polluticoccus soli TaxID=3034150 RepID=UPI0023E1B9E0|nr:gliding motility-associated C-terminal domain-containing protein [Flavipsychrobacter sp. JY13-12]